MWEETPGRPHDLVQRRLRGGTVVRGAPAQRGDPGRGGAGLAFRRSVVRLKRGPAQRVKDWPLLEQAAEALVSAAQMNVIEFHTWNSTIRNIDKPDRMVFDLDPGADVAWTHVQEAALLTRALLTELGLSSWLKTSGGKGLHIVVPLAPRLSYDAVKDLSQAIVQHPCADHSGALRRQEPTGEPRRPDLRRLPAQ